VSSDRNFGLARLLVGLAGLAEGGTAPVESGLTLTDLRAMNSSARIGDFGCRPSVVELTSARNSEEMPPSDVGPTCCQVAGILLIPGSCRGRQTDGGESSALGALLLK